MAAEVQACVAAATDKLQTEAGYHPSQIITGTLAHAVALVKAHGLPVEASPHLVALGVIAAPVKDEGGDDVSTSKSAASA